MDDVLTTVRWVVAIPVGLLFALCALGNWLLLVGVFVEFLRGRGRSFSLILPFIGPALGVVFFVTVPVEGAARLCWLALLIEPTAIIFPLALLSLLLEKHSGSARE